MEWSQLTIDTKVPKYTVMDVTDERITLSVYDLSGTILNLCTVTKPVAEEGA